MTSLIPEDLTRPGTHALVIGVSAYKFLIGGTDENPAMEELGIGQLTAAARSASEFAAWLLDGYRREDRPLSSLRVLLSESPGEVIHPTIQAMLSGDHRATRANVNQILTEFIVAATHRTENVAIVYVAGHGVQFTKNGAVLLLDDYGDPLHRFAQYTGAMDMTSIHRALNHIEAAHTQFWFLDLCRDVPADLDRYDELGGVLKLDERRLGQTMSSPIFLSTSSGQGSYARPGKVTLFNEALMAGLIEGRAARTDREGDATWRVTVTTLVEYLPNAVKLLADDEQKVQQVDVTGKVINTCFHECSTVPEVDLTISIKPGLNHTNYKASLKFRGAKLYSDHATWPLMTRVRAGLYFIEVTTLAPYSLSEDCLSIQPPTSEKELPLYEC